jgi:cysteine desulfurase/selenocysteine lyase
MSLSQDLTPIRELFPVTEKCIYFNHASTGPMSLPARKIIEDCIDTYIKQAEFELENYFKNLDNARALIAKLISAEPEEITFTQNTSSGLYISLINLPLKPNDKILVMDEVFPAARYVVDYNLPYLEKSYVSFCGKDPVEVVEKNLDKNVKAVVIDLTQYFTGETIDLKHFSNFLKQKEIYLIVDGIQAIGAMEFNVKDIEIDFLACGAAKWLFGPSGAGFLYVNKKNFKILNRLHTGWLGADFGYFEKFESLPKLFDDARMFEQGTRNIIGIRAFSENVKILLDFGLGNVEKKILELKNDLRRIFKELKYEILTPENGPQSGIITIRPKRDVRSIFNLLKENSVVVSLRNDCLRFSPHFYNTKHEIENIFAVLRQ